MVDTLESTYIQRLKDVNKLDVNKFKEDKYDVEIYKAITGAAELSESLLFMTSIIVSNWFMDLIEDNEELKKQALNNNFNKLIYY